MTHELLDRDADALERRLRAAMTEIAAGYRTGTAAETPTGRRRRDRWVVGAAAAAVALIGAAGVWALHDRHARPAASETTEVVAPTPLWLAGLTVPDVEEPDTAIQLDPSLGVDELALTSPYQHWLYSREPLVSRWFIQADRDIATAMLTIDDQPAWAWDRRTPADEYDLAGVEAERNDAGYITWRTADGVRTVTSAGLDTAFVDEFVADIVDVSDPAELSVPDGFSEITQVPIDTWQIGGDWSAGLFRPALDERDMMLSTWALRLEGAEPIPGGWLIEDPDGGDGWLAAIAVDDAAAIVFAPDSVTEATMRDIANLVSIVPAAQVPTTSVSMTRDGTLVTDSDVLAGGELEWGRWIAIDVNDTQTAAGVQCFEFHGSIDLDGCSDPASADLTLCRRLTSNPEYVDDTGRWVAVTTQTIGPGSSVSVTVADKPAEFTIEQSGGMTFIYGATHGAVHSISITLPDGTSLCPD